MLKWFEFLYKTRHSLPPQYLDVKWQISFLIFVVDSFEYAWKFTIYSWKQINSKLQIIKHSSSWTIHQLRERFMNYSPDWLLDSSRKWQVRERFMNSLSSRKFTIWEVHESSRSLNGPFNVREPFTNVHELMVNSSQTFMDKVRERSWTVHERSRTVHIQFSRDIRHTKFKISDDFWWPKSRRYFLFKTDL